MIPPFIKMNLSYKDLKLNGFKNSGYWWIKDKISINLMSKTIRYNQPPFIDFELQDKTIEDIENLIIIFNTFDLKK